ncbi:hypothetical protein [Streptomyces sp. NBC_01190]|uniref:hypothetical protein n=1 Tax=Streptomyces sp. NBC_01190 TaxID=2903767 RepID=UPI00386651CF|nr:hypothetical protein OG519_02455 [Streptomyces sp. NBC_01190]
MLGSGDPEDRGAVDDDLEEAASVVRTAMTAAAATADEKPAGLVLPEEARLLLETRDVVPDLVFHQLGHHLGPVNVGAARRPASSRYLPLVSHL